VDGRGGGEFGRARICAGSGRRGDELGGGKSSVGAAGVSTRPRPSCARASSALRIAIRRETNTMTSDEWAARTAELRAELAASAGASRGRGRGYGPEARAKAVELGRGLVAAGKSVRQSASAMGIHEATLKAWMGEAAGSSAERGFAQVRVAEATSSAEGNLRLVLPGGGRIEGLDVRSAAALVRALAG